MRRGKTQYRVAAGAGRLRALKALAAEKHFPKHFPVPCLLVDGDAAAESSIAENAVRIPMHPADQIVALSRLVREGATAEQIAARFGVSERTVQKRVRLGGLPDEVIAAYREGRVNADTVEAFATTDDTDFQRAVLESLPQAGQLYGHNVRQALSPPNRTNPPWSATSSPDLGIYAAWCGERGLAAIPADPATVAAFVDDMAESRALTWPLRQRLLAGAGTRAIDARDRALVAVAYDGMLRRAELSDLQLSDCVEEMGGDASLLVRRGKTDPETRRGRGRWSTWRRTRSRWSASGSLARTLREWPER